MDFGDELLINGWSNLHQNWTVTFSNDPLYTLRSTTHLDHKQKSWLSTPLKKWEVWKVDFFVYGPIWLGF